SPLVPLLRKPGAEEVFWIGVSGDVSTTWRSDTDAAHGFWWVQQAAIAFPGSVRAGSPLVVLSRHPEAEEAFWIGANGDVSRTWRSDFDAANGFWWHQQFAIAAPGSVRSDSPLVVTSRPIWREDIFWISAKGGVSHVWRDDTIDGGLWHTPVAIAGPGSVRAGSPLIVFWRTRQSMEVFWLGANGDVSSTFVG